MKKLTTIVLSFLFLVLNTAKADFAVGITGAFHEFDVSGTETTRKVVKKILEVTQVMLLFQSFL